MYSEDQRILDYTKNIKINNFFDENGKDIKVIIKEIVLSNCNPTERKKLEL